MVSMAYGRPYPLLVFENPYMVEWRVWRPGFSASLTSCV